LRGGGGNYRTGGGNIERTIFFGRNIKLFIQEREGRIEKVVTLGDAPSPDQERIEGKGEAIPRGKLSAWLGVPIRTKLSLEERKGPSAGRGKSGPFP